MAADPFADCARVLKEARVRYVVIGVWGANLYARSGHTVFTTQDHDLFLPLDPDNELRALAACESIGLALWCGGEPLDRPRDLFLAERIVERRALVRATDAKTLDVDLSLVMASFDFDTVWSERRDFVVSGVAIPVARLSHIVRSKAAAGRDKDRLFLATHAEALRELLGEEDQGG